ncbi:MAG: D-aminoacyl-tRNA deacylase [Negativicutes bacterium]
MRAVVQRTGWSEVTVGGECVGRAGNGLTVLLGVGREDTEEDARYMADKIAHLRIFEDDAGKMNLSVQDVSGQILAISQFTLYGDCRKGRRPSFDPAASAENARSLYEKFVCELRAKGLTVECGQFQAEMKVTLENQGPVTLMIDSKKRF